MEARWQSLYDPQTPHSLNYPATTLPELLIQTARTYPQRIATKLTLTYLLNGRIRIGGSLTYQRLLSDVERLATALANLGLRKGDRVALVLPNSPQYVIAFFAALSLGAVVVNNNPQYKAYELKHQIIDSNAETVVILNLFWPNLESILAETPVKRVIVTTIYDLLTFPYRQLVATQQRRSADWVEPPQNHPNVYQLEQLLRNTPATPPAVAISPDDVALLQYTGGTTGTPKAAMLTHHNLIANARQCLAWVHVVEPGREVFVLAIPFFHVYGMTTGLLCGVISGATLVLVPNPRPITLVMDAIQHERGSVVPGVPALYLGIVKAASAGQYDLHSVKACISGSDTLPLPLQRDFEALTGGKLVEGYGLTEASPVTHCSPLFGTRKEGSIGLPVSDTEAKIIDPSTGEDLPFDGTSRGELLVRGPQVMKGYWNRPEETAATLEADGWLHTGDICTVDEQGYFFVVDRMKDIIKASGFQVLPREVEEVLYLHPAVREVCVAGVPNAARGDETVTAFVVLKPGATATAEELRAFCAERLIKYKVPRVFRFRDSLPRSTVGKTLRRELVADELRTAITSTE